MKTLPQLEPLPIQKKYFLTKNFHVFCYIRCKNREVVISPMYTDGGSIPRILWSTTITPYDPRGIIPFIVHDDGYRRAGLFVVENGAERFISLSRKELDQILRSMMKTYGVNIYLRNKIYYGVRVGGWVAWKNLRRTT